jgi:hypothetical protein
MRAIAMVSAAAACILVTMPNAHAQMSLRQMVELAKADCVNKGGSPQFCSCYVNRWIGLLTPEDQLSIFSPTNPSPTAHSMQMEQVARGQCGG